MLELDDLHTAMCRFLSCRQIKNPVIGKNYDTDDYSLNYVSLVGCMEQIFDSLLHHETSNKQITILVSSWYEGRIPSELTTVEVDREENLEDVVSDYSNRDIPTLQGKLRLVNYGLQTFREKWKEEVYAWLSHEALSYKWWQTSFGTPPPGPAAKTTIEDKDWLSTPEGLEWVQTEKGKVWLEGYGGWKWTTTTDGGFENVKDWELKQRLDLKYKTPPRAEHRRTIYNETFPQRGIPPRDWKFVIFRPCARENIPDGEIRKSQYWVKPPKQDTDAKSSTELAAAPVQETLPVPVSRDQFLLEKTLALC
ncbi:hypothetical protein F5Y15DRAFT_380983 [Xylariaceae sp. FL0016]|nr:hypothetical protein F5Y15DRAFT_380983 [Xylariaceae sp. FL0016]